MAAAELTRDGDGTGADHAVADRGARARGLRVARRLLDRRAAGTSTCTTRPTCCGRAARRSWRSRSCSSDTRERPRFRAESLPWRSSPPFRRPRRARSTSVPLTIHMYGLMLLARHRGLHLADRLPLDQARRRLGSDLPRRRLGCRRRDRRRAALPPGDELGPGAGGVVGPARGLGGRPRDLGRNRGRRPRRRLHRDIARARTSPRCSTPPRPGLLIAQAIGRIGNWWNQELFGKPTDLPWALEIDVQRRPDAYPFEETFHPTFLYEGLWNLFAAGVLLCSTASSASARRRSSRSTSSCTRASASSSSGCASTRPASSSECGRTRRRRRRLHPRHGVVHLGPVHA